MPTVDLTYEELDGLRGLLQDRLRDICKDLRVLNQSTQDSTYARTVYLIRQGARKYEAMIDEIDHLDRKLVEAMQRDVIDKSDDCRTDPPDWSAA